MRSCRLRLERLRGLHCWKKRGASSRSRATSPAARRRGPRRCARTYWEQQRAHAHHLSVFRASTDNINSVASAAVALPNRWGSTSFQLTSSEHVHSQLKGYFHNLLLAARCHLLLRSNHRSIFTQTIVRLSVNKHYYY